MNYIIKAFTLSECMEAMAEHAQAFEQMGGKNIIFCEDRLTLIAERALLARSGGTFHSSVSTFARFLKTDERAISKQGSVMAVGDIMTRLQRDGALQCFKTAASVGKNAGCIYETLAQMKASRITPEELNNSIEKMRKEASKNGTEKLPDDMLCKKISDLKIIYEEYDKFLLSKGYLDESKYLTLLSERIRKEGLLKGYNVFFLGYNSFTKQAMDMIAAAAKTANNVVGVFCDGEESLYTHRVVNAFKEALKECGDVMTKEVKIPLGGEAERLRKGLFTPEKMGKPTYTENIIIYEGEDKIAEAEFVATKIRREMGEDSALRYKDFAVLVPNVAAYSLPLKKVFDEYGIPYFIDEKKSLRRHPLTAFLLSCFRVVKEGYSPNAVQALTQNVFFGESDEYRNYLLKYANYRGGAKQSIKNNEIIAKNYNIAKMEDGRARLLAATEPIKLNDTGCGYVQAVREIIKSFEIDKKLEKLSDDIDDLAQKGYLAQIARALDGVLVEAKMLTGGKEMSASEFASILQDGLEATEISLIPLKADAVFIGDVTDSRIEKVGVLFAMGMTDEVPRCGGDTALISDSDIKRLETLKTYLEPKVADVNLRARESLCLNLCTFMKRLYLTYPLGSDGETPITSDVFRYIDNLFCRNEKEEKLLRRKKYDLEDFEYSCSALTPAVRQFLLLKREYLSKDSKQLREELKRQKEQQLLQEPLNAEEQEKANKLKEEVQAQELRKAQYSSVYAVLKELGVDAIDGYWAGPTEQEIVTTSKELLLKNEKISPTALEKYFECPFKLFAGNGLRLKEREEAAVLAVDTGNFVHKLLEKTMPKTSEIKTEEDMRKFAREEGKKLLNHAIYEAQQDTDVGTYFTERLLEEGVAVALAAYRHIANSTFKVEHMEKEIHAPFFHGFVDRVDVADSAELHKKDEGENSIDSAVSDKNSKKYVRIVDYKTGSIDESAGAYYTGRKLQMELYMSEVKGDRIPAGVLYFPASLDYTTDGEGRFRMKGFLNGNTEALKCADDALPIKGASEYISAALENPAQRTSVMKEDVFLQFLDYAKFVAEQATNEIKSGYVKATPYKDGCKFCKYGGMCGFKKDVARERKEAKIAPKEIAGIAEAVKAAQAAKNAENAQENSEGGEE